MGECAYVFIILIVAGYISNRLNPMPKLEDGYHWEENAELQRALARGGWLPWLVLFGCSIVASCIRDGVSRLLNRKRHTSLRAER